MNWFDQYKKDFGFKSNYHVSKKTGITASSLTRLNNSDDWKNVKIGTCFYWQKRWKRILMV
ncbi:XRE family transcriptional regulator [Enterococcus hirae]|uniref:XRE family transcriptional regulator n=1 Tax=Enterococcus hirae TaxID=1354 RepID=UPI001F605F40|nr:XRE family transcriptional regulator [Enterococcus hirae]MEB7516407.1 XRE family transcriptional regulator [Enterococcus hirae]